MNPTEELESARKAQVLEALVTPIAFVIRAARCLVAAPQLLWSVVRGRVTGKEFRVRFAESGWSLWYLFCGSIESFLLLPIMALGWLVGKVGPYSGIIGAGTVTGIVLASIFSYRNPSAEVGTVLSIVWVTAAVFSSLILCFVIFAYKKIKEEEEEDE